MSRHMPARPGRWGLPRPTINPDGAGHDILAIRRRASGSLDSPRPSTPARPPGWPGSSSAPSWRGAGGPSPAGSAPSGWAANSSPATRPSPRPASRPTSPRPASSTTRSGRWSPSSRRITLALDDTPTERYGPYVQGAGIHHNPTPGPAGSPHVYGHIWVVLGLLAAHPRWGVIALPLLARLYVRASRPAGHRPEASARVPDQAPDGRRAAAMGPDVAEVPGQADLGGGRRGLRQGAVPQAGDRRWG